MADFEPTSAIYFFEGTCVSPQNQPFFYSEADKLAWYQTHNTKQFTSYSYQRENRQYIRVEAKAAEMRKYDMMCFRNDPADRWIFCRVVEVEFINPNTTQVTFETDSLQTFIDVCVFEDCWVEREMQVDDWDGDYPSFNNLMPEGLEVGPMQESLLANPTLDIMQSGLSVVVLSAYDINAEPNYNVITDGNLIYGINTLILYSAADVNALLTIYEKKGKLDGIVGMWLVPRGWETWRTKTYNIDQPKGVGPYLPKNAKLLTSEFCEICLTNRQGVTSLLQPEFLFSRRGAGGTHVAKFDMSGGFLAGGGGILLYPDSYMDGTLDQNSRQDYGVVLAFDLQTCYVGNSFANWVSQHKGELMVQSLQGVAQVASGASALGVGIATTNPLIFSEGAKSVSGAFYNGLQTMLKLQEKSTHPAGAFGQVSAGNLMARNNQYGFVIYYRYPIRQVAESIDNFFTVYGYRTCRVKVPNIHTRPYWNYVKCAPAVVSGPFTSRDRYNIESALNEGVTFWHVTNGAVIGDYSMDNRG